MNRDKKGYARGDARARASDTLNIELGNRLKIAREHLGKSQREMDSLLGLGSKSWQRNESGGHAPGSKVIAALVAQGFNANWLLSGEGPMLREEPGDTPEDDVTAILLDELKVIRQELKEVRAENKHQAQENRRLAQENRRLMHENDDLRGQLMEKNVDPERDFIVPVVNLQDADSSGWRRVSPTPMFTVAPLDIHKNKGFAAVVPGNEMAPSE